MRRSRRDRDILTESLARRHGAFRADHRRTSTTRGGSAYPRADARTTSLRHRMSTTHGGHRTPANPAPASGPGKLSRRTDGVAGQKLMVAAGGAYGDRQGLLDQEKTAAMSQTPTVPAATIPTQPSTGGAAPALTPFDAPSQRPGEPITSGVPTGPGPGPAMGPINPAAGTGSMTALLQRLSPTDTTGILGQLFQAAQARDA